MTDTRMKRGSATRNGIAGRRAAAFITAAALTLSTLFAAPGVFPKGTSYAADGQSDTLSYPWSERSGATGDYFYDSYDGVPKGSVFENVTTDRLLDILSSNGNYYIVFAGPEHGSSQTILSTIHSRAKAKGVSRIYHFDPYVDGYQLDITGKNGVADVTGGTSVNFGGTAKVSDVWRLITQLLPSSAVEGGGALHDYDGKDTLLFNVKITDRRNVNAGKVVASSYRLTDADAKVGGFSASTQTSAIDVALSGGAASERSEWAFFKRVYNGSASYFEKNFSASADRIGAPVEIFGESDFPGGAGFALDSIDVKELYDLLNAPGEFPVLFAGAGCHNTQAVIGEVAKAAKRLGAPKVYVLDLSLDSNVKFGAGADIDTVTHNGATSGLWIRNSGVVPSSPYKYGYTYLYGYLARYFGNAWITQDSSRKSDSVPYFIDGALGGAQTVDPYFENGDNPDIGTADVPNAKRMQVPFLLRYNKAAANKIVAQWLHENASEGGGYTEYMLELAWVRQTAAAKADKARSSGRDGLTKTEFAAEAVAALGSVLKPGVKLTHSIATSPVPEIGGMAAISSVLTAYPNEWSHSPTFSYKWLADGKAIAGATAETYKTKTSDAGKRISVSVTGTRRGYAPVTKTSARTDPIGVFKIAPTPVIKGTAKLGTTFGLDWGSWSPWPADAKFSFQWYRDGVRIDGATENKYKLVIADLGKRITASVTASAPGYTTTTKTSAATAAVAGYEFKSAPTPKINGAAKAGKNLSVDLGTWSPKPAAYAYQWYADGKEVKGATKNAYKLAAVDIGKRLTVRVTATAPGYVALTKTSAATAAVKGYDFKKAPKPKIKGTAKVGKKLKVNVGAWSPKPKYKYQWYANGKKIKGAVKTTLKLKKTQKGKKITVAVTARKAGYISVTKRSSPTKKVRK